MFLSLQGNNNNNSNNLSVNSILIHSLVYVQYSWASSSQTVIFLFVFEALGKVQSDTTAFLVIFSPKIYKKGVVALVLDG